MGLEACGSDQEDVFGSKSDEEQVKLLQAKSAHLQFDQDYYVDAKYLYRDPCKASVSTMKVHGAFGTRAQNSRIAKKPLSTMKPF